MLSLKSLTVLAAYIATIGVSVVAAPTADNVGNPGFNGVKMEAASVGRKIGKVEKREAGGVSMTS